jgi:hypothetical protein
MNSPENCETCADNRMNPPACPSDEAKFSQNTSNKCVPLKWNIQCDMCSFTSSNCETCKFNRDSPLSCSCIPNSF